MAILSKGTDFSTGDQVTAAKLDALVDSATFASGAVDDSTTQLDGNGKIIVKDGGITSAKLNLSATGVSQTIASFKTTQDGSNRALDILTPSSTTDLNSPFELATGNAIKFSVDTTSMEIGSSGTVTINGQTNNGDSVLQLVSTSGSDTSKLGFGDDGDSDIGGIAYNHSDNSMRFSTSTSERLRIIGDGKVGIGTTSPSSELEVVGDILINNGGSDGGQLILASAGNNTMQIDNESGNFRVVNNTLGTELLRIDNDGDLAMGSTSTGGSSFDGNSIKLWPGSGHTSVKKYYDFR
jgi:hypothetical protein